VSRTETLAAEQEDGVDAATADVLNLFASGRTRREHGRMTERFDSTEAPAA
jgi:hypothetical protein